MLKFPFEMTKNEIFDLRNTKLSVKELKKKRLFKFSKLKLVLNLGDVYCFLLSSSVTRSRK